jgi:hypothetical protein
VVLRRKLMALLMTAMLVVMSAAPALAAHSSGGGHQGPKDPMPISPPGRDIGKGNPPEQAAHPQTGKINRNENGSPQNGK